MCANPFFRLLRVRRHRCRSPHSQQRTVVKISDAVPSSASKGQWFEIRFLYEEVNGRASVLTIEQEPQSAANKKGNLLVNDAIINSE